MRREGGGDGRGPGWRWLPGALAAALCSGLLASVNGAWAQQAGRLDAATGAPAVATPSGWGASLSRPSTDDRPKARLETAPSGPKRAPDKPAAGEAGPSRQGRAAVSAAPAPASKAAAPADAPRIDGVVASNAHVVASAHDTRFHLTLARPLKAEVYAVARPHRIVIDFPEAVDFRLPPRAGQEGAGLVASYRSGLVAAQQSRIVLDLRRPVRVASAQMVAQSDGSGAFAVSLVPIAETDFLKTAYEPPKLRRKTLADDPAPPAAKAVGRPVVVIDPGHGGIDPGAVGQTEIAEKNIVLEVGRRLKALLEASRRYDVRMTRDTDVFVPLDERVAQSQTAGADLFISIHADAIGEDAAAKVRGATVYTLSERASDSVARRLAEKENASDTLAGLATVAADDRDVVRNILIDLMKTETSRFSSEFGQLVTERLRRTIALSRTPRRSAAFRVLKQAEITLRADRVGLYEPRRRRKADGHAGLAEPRGPVIVCGRRRLFRQAQGGRALTTSAARQRFGCGPADRPAIWCHSGKFDFFPSERTTCCHIA